MIDIKNPLLKQIFRYYAPAIAIVLAILSSLAPLPSSVLYQTPVAKADSSTLILPYIQGTSTGVTYTAGSTRYICIGGGNDNPTAVEGKVQIKAHDSYTWSKAYIKVISNTTTADSTLVSRINGANGNQSITIPAGTTGTFYDSEHSDSLTNGNLFNWRLTTGAGGSLVITIVGCLLESSNDSCILLSARADGGETYHDETQYYAIQSFTSATAGAVEDREDIVKYTFRTDTTLSNFRVAIAQNTLTEDSTITLRINGANGNQSVTVPAGTTGIFEDITNTDGISAGDEVNVQVEAGTGEAGTRITPCLFQVKSSASVRQMVSQECRHLPFNTTRYFPIEGGQRLEVSGTTTESDVQALFQTDVVAERMFVNIWKNTLDGSTSITLRKNGVDTDLSITIPSGETGFFENLSDSVHIDSNDLVDWEISTEGTAGEIYIFGSAGGIELRMPSTTGNSTTVGSLALIPTFECISVYANFSNDGNVDNSATLEYRESGGTWKQGMDLTVDRRDRILSKEGSTPQYIDNPYRSQWRGSIFGLTPDTQYEVRVTFTDADGVTGTNPITGSITTRNDVFSLGSGSTYHVAKDGNDVDDGSAESPWLTIQNALDNVSTGDTIYIHEGTYIETLSMTTSGESDNYITLLPYNNETVVVDFNNAYSGFTLNGVNYFRVSGGDKLTFRNANHRAIYLYNSHYNVFEYCSIEDFGYQNPDAGIAITSGSAYNLIQHNTITTARNTYEDTAHRAGGVCMYSQPGGGNVIRNNYIYGVDGGMSDGIGGSANSVVQDGPYKDSDIYDNIIVSVEDDGYEVEGGDICVRAWGNKVATPESSGFASAACLVGPLYNFSNIYYNLKSCGHKSGATNQYNGHQYIYHNSYYSIQTSPNRVYGQGSWGGEYLENCHYLNNIIYVTTATIDVRAASLELGNTFDYDCLWNEEHGKFAYWGEDIANLLDFQTASNQELHGISADPKFVDPDNGDLHLKSDSPCIDAGIVIPGFNDANSPWPYSGSAPDIGAYEYGSGPPIDNTPPYTTGHNPTKGAAGIARDTNIVVHVRDNGTGVDQSSIVMTVEGTTVTPTITGTPSNYTLTYNPPSDFDYEQIVNVTVDARDLNSPPNVMTQDPYSFTTIAIQPHDLPIRVNCAGADYTDVSGKEWQADQAYVPGDWGFYGDDNTIDRGTGLAIINTNDDRIYQTERYGLDGYRFDLGNGTYKVNLHFAEAYSEITGVGQRVFNVYIEGQLVLDNLDIYSEVGSNTALIKTINDVSVTDGQLTIEFTQITEQPEINGIMITDAVGNQPPVVLNDDYSIAVDSTLNLTSPGVLANDYDTDGDSLIAVLVGDVSHGNLTLNANGSFTYTPDSGYTGTDSFTYQASDGQENSNTATVTLTIHVDNQAPVLSLIGDQAVAEGALLEFIISATDNDGDWLTYFAYNLPQGAQFNPGNRTFSWTPDYDQSGTYDNIYFAVSDGEVSDSEDITIIVNGVNEPYDVNDDGAVNILDMISVGQHWDEVGTNGWIPEDVNSDGIISVLDIILISQNLTE